ncbi:hypothetical protein J2S43_000978 [Catenuloplanes nepalensis]|uniref:DUF397 domain-containing protein n=1 Tax=Catenuloplanes nepalensis TaxID=587533 RepID=A0ABT9MMB3_9ACTN|nr:DUF397 domain-containing protein [Catenuloplanes nepalensis]MDP9792466.1 hypothetical protein [Catenuloplanes nepalensis]
MARSSLPLGPAWRKSSRSASSGECVEARRWPEGVEIRDSKNPHGPTFTVSATAWTALTGALGDGLINRSGTGHP